MANCRCLRTAKDDGIERLAVGTVHMSDENHAIPVRDTSRDIAKVELSCRSSENGTEFCPLDGALDQLFTGEELDHIESICLKKIC
jgi:hypothetical protein